MFLPKNVSYNISTQFELPVIFLKILKNIIVYQQTNTDKRNSCFNL